MFGLSSTHISRGVNAPRAIVYRALLDARAVATRIVPTGMTMWCLIDQAPSGEERTAYLPSLRRQLYCASSNGVAAQQEDGKEGMA